MSRPVLLIGGGLVIGVAVFIGARHSSSDSEVLNDNARDPASVNRGELESPARAVESPAREQHADRRPVRPGLPTPATAEPTAHVKPTAAELEEQRKEALRRRVALFEAAFDKEVIDGAWSQEYEDRVKIFFDQQSGNSLEQVQCRSTLCRAVVRHDDTSARQQFSESLGSEPFTGGSFYYPAKEGAFESVAYLGRPGVPFRVPREAIQ